jgi:hypothetical protein
VFAISDTHCRSLQLGHPWSSISLPKARMHELVIGRSETMTVEFLDGRPKQLLVLAAWPIAMRMYRKQR